LSKCQAQYNAAFFKWHERFSSSQAQRHVEFINRLQLLIEMENKHTDIIQEKDAINALYEAD
jgi:hypothetical protein